MARERIVWNEKRKELLKRLSEYSDVRVWQLYKHLIDGIESYIKSSDPTQIDLMHIAHDVRELLNFFSDLIGGKGSNSNAYGDEHRALEHLRSVLVKELSDDSLNDPDGMEVFSVPAKLVGALNVYRDAVMKGHKNSIEKDAYLATGYLNPADPAVIPLRKARHFFMQFVHIKRNSNIIPSESDLLNNLEAIENAISTNLGLFFTLKGQLKDILANANMVDAQGDYIAPSAQEVTITLSQLGNNNLKLVFFSQLKNPEWLHELNRIKAFRVPEISEDQKQKINHWYEGLYLKEMAGKKPKEVEEILLNLIKVDNITVRGEAIEVASLMPAEYAKSIAKEISGWAKDELYHEYFWGRSEIVTLISNLLQWKNNKTRRTGKELFTNYFRPIIVKDYFVSIKSLMPDYLYGNSVTDLGDLLSAKEFVGIFQRYVEIIANSSTLPSNYLFPEIKRAYRGRDKTVANEIIAQLVDGFTNFLASGYFADFNYKIDEAKNSENNLAARCALYALVSYIDSLGETELSISLKEYMKEFILSDAIIDGEFDTELFPLIHQAIEKRIVKPEEITELITDSYDSVLDRYRERLNDTGALEEDRLKERADKWQQRALYLVGLDYLDAEAANLYQAFVSRYGELKFEACRVGETEIAVGSNSPLTLDDMSMLKPQELICFLANWQPSNEDRFKLIEPEGLKDTLKELIINNPYYFNKVTNQVKALPAVYQRGIFEGWHDSLRDQKKIPLDVSIELIDNVANHDGIALPDKCKEPCDCDSHRLLSMSALSLIEELLDSLGNAISKDSLVKIKDALIRFSKSANPDKEYEDKYSNGSSDALTVSMNSVRPCAIRLLAKWLWSNKGSVDFEDVLKVFADHLPNKDMSIADAAALGYSFPALIDSEPSFLSDHFWEVFGDIEANECQQIVFSTILVLYRPKKQVFDFLKPAIVKNLDLDLEHFRLSVGRSFLGKRNCMERVGDWLYRGLAYGVIDKNDPLLEKWISKASDIQLGSVLNHLCWLFGKSEELPEKVIRTVGKIWDYHRDVLVSEKGSRCLRGMRSLASLGKYETSWWGPRLVEEYQINLVDTEILLVEDELKALTEKDPDMALGLLMAVLDGDDNPFYYSYYEISVTVLRAVKKKHGGELTEKAKRCMDKLGSIGCVDLDEKI